MNKEEEFQPTTTTLLAACVVLRRKARIERPEGKSDGGGRWYPSEREAQDCCCRIRAPSRHWPMSLLKHCCTAEHVAELHGAELREVNRTIRLLTKRELLPVAAETREEFVARATDATPAGRARALVLSRAHLAAGGDRAKPIAKTQRAPLL